MNTQTASSPSTSNLNTQPNPFYLSWRRTDQLIFSILLSSLTESVIGHAASTTTSLELWRALESTFNSQPQAKEFQIRLQLINLACGERTILDYFRKVRMLVDTLSSTGNPLPDKYFVTYLLIDLGPSYESFITTRVEPISFHELYFLLVIHESKMSHFSSSNSTSHMFELSTNLTTGHSRDQRGRPPYRGGRFNRGRNKFSNNRGRNSPSYHPLSNLQSYH